jgi:hypothetical protein
MAARGGKHAGAGRVPGATGCQGLRDPAHKHLGKEGRLTRGLRRPELQWAEETDDDQRRRDWVLAGRGDAEVAGPSGWRE